MTAGAITPRVVSRLVIGPPPQARQLLVRGVQARVAGMAPDATTDGGVACPQEK